MWQFPISCTQIAWPCGARGGTSRWDPRTLGRARFSEPLALALGFALQGPGPKIGLDIHRVYGY